MTDLTPWTALRQRLERVRNPPPDHHANITIDADNVAYWHALVMIAEEQWRNAGQMAVLLGRLASYSPEAELRQLKADLAVLQDIDRVYRERYEEPLLAWAVNQPEFGGDDPEGSPDGIDHDEMVRLVIEKARSTAPLAWRVFHRDRLKELLLLRGCDAESTELICKTVFDDNNPLPRQEAP